MKKQTYDSTHAIFLTILALVMATGVALSIVWMRQQIYKSAQCTRALEQQLEKIQRQGSYLVSKIAELQSPAKLKQFAATHNLVPPTDKQTVWVTSAHVIAANEQPKAQSLVAYHHTHSQHLIE